MDANSLAMVQLCHRLGFIARNSQQVLQGIGEASGTSSGSGRIQRAERSERIVEGVVVEADIRGGSLGQIVLQPALGSGQARRCRVFGGHTAGGIQQHRKSRSLLVPDGLDPFRIKEADDDGCHDRPAQTSQ